MPFSCGCANVTRDTIVVSLCPKKDGCHVGRSSNKLKQWIAEQCVNRLSSYTMCHVTQTPNSSATRNSCVPI